MGTGVRREQQISLLGQGLLYISTIYKFNMSKGQLFKENIAVLEALAAILRAQMYIIAKLPGLIHQYVALNIHLRP